MKRVLTVLSVVLIAGCTTHQTPAAPSTSPGATSPTTTTAASPTSSAPTAPPSSTPPTDTPTAAPAGQCSDSDLGVTNGDVASANTLRHVTVSFKNTSSHPCAVTRSAPGYPVIAQGCAGSRRAAPRQCGASPHAQPRRCSQRGCRVLRDRHHNRERLPSRRHIGRHSTERLPIAPAPSQSPDLQCDHQLGGLSPTTRPIIGPRCRRASRRWSGAAGTSPPRGSARLRPRFL